MAGAPTPRLHYVHTVYPPQIVTVDAADGSCLPQKYLSFGSSDGANAEAYARLAAIDAAGDVAFHGSGAAACGQSGVLV